MKHYNSSEKTKSNLSYEFRQVECRHFPGVANLEAAVKVFKIVYLKIPVKISKRRSITVTLYVFDRDRMMFS